MKKYTCIIVDDEVLARELIAAHIAKIPNIEILADCADAISAKLALQQHEPDILFLDIQMPNLSGIELLRMLQKKPATIITTAHQEHLLEGYELDVIDYILKPIEFERFFKAASKAMEWVSYRNNNIGQSYTNVSTEKAANYFFVKSDYKTIKIVFDEILFIEALEKYVKIHSSSAPVMTLMSISQLETLLPPDKFVRIHRSYIVNMDKVDSIEANMVNIGKHQLTSYWPV